MQGFEGVVDEAELMGEGEVASSEVRGSEYSVKVS